MRFEKKKQIKRYMVFLVEIQSHFKIQIAIKATALIGLGE